MRSTLTYAIALNFGLVFHAASAGAAGAPTAPGSTPAGITLIDVTNSNYQFMWRHLADISGKPLYTYDADGDRGQATCIGDCAKQFSPYLAPRNAKAVGDWTLVQNGASQFQWVYRGRPLYLFNGKDPGEDVSNGRRRSPSDDELMDPAYEMFSPKKGWRRAAFTPETSTPTPSGIVLKSTAVANGYGFVDQSSGMALYTLRSAPKNQRAWNPMYAPGLAQEVGDFTIAQREDGKRQWAYKGQLLYTFKEDYSNSDLNGLLAQADAQPALAYQHFMPRGVRIDFVPTRGPIMVTADRMSLYAQSRYKLQYGGRQIREGYRYSYAEARAVGPLGCVNACLRRWKPFVASKSDQASGFWEIQVRPDGVRQWAYKGSPVYTYVDDKKPGDIEGNNVHEIVYGDPEGKVDLTLTGGNRETGVRSAAGSGFYWHLVGLYN